MSIPEEATKSVVTRRNCEFCGNVLLYDGKGQPRKRCPDCQDAYRRAYRREYMKAYMRFRRMVCNKDSSHLGESNLSCHAISDPLIEQKAVRRELERFGLRERGEEKLNV